MQSQRMRSLFYILIPFFIFGSLLNVARAQGPLKTQPHLSLAFPFEEKNEGIGLEYPVLINEGAVIPSDAILRVIYNPPRLDDAEVLVQQQQANQDVAYSKLHRLKSQKPLSPQELAALKIARETHWPTATMFQLALAQLGSSDLRMVYIDPVALEMYEEDIRLPEGLFLAAVQGKVKVLAVEDKSRAHEVGIQAGDSLWAVGEQELEGDLHRFIESYREAKASAKVSSERQYTMTVEGKDGAQREVIFRLPISLNSSFLEMPIDIQERQPASQEAPSKPALPVPGPWLKKSWEDSSTPSP